MATEGLKAASALATQVTTLSSAMLGFTVTFVDKFRKGPNDIAAVSAELQGAWACYILAVVFAVWTLMAVTGSLDVLDHGREVNAKRTNVRVPSFLMLAAFLAGLVLTALAGAMIV